MKSVQNWISYIHANFYIFSPSLAILFNLLDPESDLGFLEFYFDIHFESGEVPMD
jgi:hypothetical protein